MTSVTTDSISLRGAGIVKITQPSRGHRFTLDSILLADFCRVRQKERLLEPGAGTGVVSLLLAKRHPRSFFSPVEIQDDLHALCRENAAANGLGNVIPLRGDIRRLSPSLLPGPFDALVANPPYGRAGTGRSSPFDGRRIARQDLLGRIEFWLDAAKWLKQGGRYTVVFPAGRLAELLSLMRERRLEPKRLRMVHPYLDKTAVLALVEAVKNGGSGVQVLPPLIVHDAGGGYSAEMKDIYGLP